MGARLMGFIGLVLLLLSAVLMDVTHGLFNADDFANRVASSLGDERVSGFVAQKITDVLIERRPDPLGLVVGGEDDRQRGHAVFR